MRMIISDCANSIHNMLFLQIYSSMNTFIVIDRVSLGYRPENAVLPDLAMRESGTIFPYGLLVCVRIVRMH